jgi:protein-S-isoprenylcysteine O-methyltransferase Ste14
MGKNTIRLFGAILIGALALLATSLEFTPRIVLGVLVGLPSLIFLAIGRRQLGDAFSVMPQAKGLVTQGLYSRIQHPMYLFLDLLLVAVIIGLGFPGLLFVWGVLIVVQLLQSRREERVLANGFGAEYEAYRSQTWF